MEDNTQEQHPTIPLSRIREIASELACVRELAPVDRDDLDVLDGREIGAALYALLSLVDEYEPVVKAVCDNWRDVGPGSADSCTWCGRSIDADTLEEADGEGWDYIEHTEDCPVRFLSKRLKDNGIRP